MLGFVSLKIDDKTPVIKTGLIFFISALCSGLVWADQVVIVGNQNVSGDFSTVDDRIYMRNDVCKSIQSAEKLGHQVHLLIPDVKCNGKSYKGQCPISGCQKQEFKALLSAVSSKITSKKQNLILQTIGHGHYAHQSNFDGKGPEDNTLVLTNSGDGISAKEFGSILNQSGILKKVNSVKALFYQCYSGGWNEMARFIRPAGKFCSFSQANHNQTGIIEGGELNNLNGSAFLNGFWDKQVASKGRATLDDSLLYSSGLAKENNQGIIPYTVRWKSSSMYFTEKEMQIGPFSPSGNSLGDYPDGMDVLGDSNSLYRTYEQIDARLMQKASKMGELYKNHLQIVSSFNSRKRFWQDEQIARDPYLLSGGECTNGERLLNVELRLLESTITRIEHHLIDKDFSGHQSALHSVLNIYRGRLAQDKHSFGKELARHLQSRNELLKQSGLLMKKINNAKTFNQKLQLSDEYKKLELKFSKLERLTDYPALFDMAVMSKKIKDLETTLKLVEDPKAAKKRDLILSSWLCENSPVSYQESSN